MKFKFGKDILSTTYYDSNVGYGWVRPSHITISDTKDYCFGNNYRSKEDTPTYEYPTFLVDLPNGIYDVTVTFCTNGKEDAVNGAYINDWIYAIPWTTTEYPANFEEPSPDTYIYTAVNTTNVQTTKIPVTNGRLKIEFASFITNEGISGLVYIKELSILDCHRSLATSKHPTINFLGCTLGKYPSENWIPIPERIGWAENFAFKRFTDGNVSLANYGIYGSSTKSYIYNGDFTHFLLSCHEGDTCVIESGVNDQTDGRRHSSPKELETYLQIQIDACIAFGQKVILISGLLSPSDYTEAIRRVAIKNNLPFINLMAHFQDYLYKTGKVFRDLTVDGFHLRRIGAIIAARFVAKELEPLQGYSFSGHVIGKNINYKAPSCTVSNPRILSQTKNSVTIGWDIDEDTIYNRRNLITDFNIYEVSPDGKELIYTAPAYVSSGMTGPKLQATLPILGGTNAYLSITCLGPTGEGPFSELIKIKSYEPTDYENLQLLIKELSSPLYDKDFYTDTTYKSMKELLQVAISYPPRSDVYGIYQKLLNSKMSLEPVATCIEKTDFNYDKPGQVPWALEGEHNWLTSVKIEEDGNHLLNLYVEAAGPRYITKYFKAATNLNASKIITTFSWYPSKPDTRNITELEFYSSNDNRVISLKAADSGEIGYVIGNYPVNDISYKVGNGFHDYPGSKATNLHLPCNTWYRVKLIFDFKNCTTDLYLNDTIVTNIPVNFDGINTITKLNFLLVRGLRDNRVTKDLSILWEMQLDNFAMYYI